MTSTADDNAALPFGMSIEPDPKRNHVRELEALDYRVTLRPAA